MKIKKTLTQKKPVPPAALPKLELLSNGKKNKSGNDLYYLYINGKANNKAFEFDDKMFVCSSPESKFTESLFPIPCKCFPDNMLLSIDFNSSLINGILYDEKTLWLSKEKNIFTMYIYYENLCNLKNELVDINYDRLIATVKDFIRKGNSKGLTIEENNDDLIVILTAKPDETIQQLFDRLINGFQIPLDKLKIYLLKEMKKVENDILNHSMKWE